MRLRIQTLPPLPDLKAWFIPDVHQIPNSIGELKGLLCSSIAVLKESGIAPGHIQLLLDDFELLDESPFAAALRDGDILCAQTLAPLPIALKAEEKGNLDQGPLLQRKRKRYGKDKLDKKHDKHAKARKVKSESEHESDSPSSSSPSSTSSSSSSSSSLSSSSNSDDSDSSSSSSPSSPPSLWPSKPLRPGQTSRHVSTLPLSLPKPRAPQGPFVPPGKGQPTTHARNLRRKRLRAAQAEGRTRSILQAAQPPHISPINALPLGERVISQPPSSPAGKIEEKERAMDVDDEAGPEVEVEVRQEVMMASLGNKNKKKGYKQFLMAPVPRKIVFTDDGAANLSPLLSASTSTSASRSNVPTSLPTLDSSASSQLVKRLPRLIPPSEIQEHGELPPNMFVTSVDVEADLWGSNGKKKKNKSRNKAADVSYEYDCSYNEEGKYQAEEDVTLSYGDEDTVRMKGGTGDYGQAPSQGTASEATFDWSQAERLFDNAPKVSGVSDFQIGQIVGWKSLDLNPQTFTPEILLIAAKVLETLDDTSSVKVQRLTRPLDPDSVYSGFLVPADPDAEGAEAEEVEVYEWTNISTSDWRILQSLKRL